MKRKFTKYPSNYVKATHCYATGYNTYWKDSDKVIGTILEFLRLKSGPISQKELYDYLHASGFPNIDPETVGKAWVHALSIYQSELSNDEDIEACGDIKASSDGDVDEDNDIDEDWLPEDISDDELIDVLCGYEWEVLNELGLDLEQNTQGCAGSITIFRKNDYENAIDIDYGEWLERENEMAFSSSSPDEFKSQFKSWMESVKSELPGDGVEACGDIKASRDSMLYTAHLKYYLAGYADSNKRALISDFNTDNFDGVLEEAHNMARRGLTVVIKNEETGVQVEYSPDVWMDAIADGEYPSGVYAIA